MSTKANTLTESMFSKQNGDVDKSTLKLEDSLGTSVIIPNLCTSTNKNDESLGNSFGASDDHPVFDIECPEYSIEDQINVVVSSATLHVQK